MYSAIRNFSQKDHIAYNADFTTKEIILNYIKLFVMAKFNWNIKYEVDVEDLKKKIEHK